MYTQTNVGLLCCVGSGSNVAVALDRAVTATEDDAEYGSSFEGNISV
jgi:hypothetical protein